MLKTILALLALAAATKSFAQNGGDQPQIVEAKQELAQATDQHGANSVEILPQLDHLIERSYFYYITDGVEPLILQALSIRSRTLGPDHPDTLTSHHQLGVLHFDVGDWQRAEIALRETLEDRLRVLGPADENTSETALYLSATLERLGRLSEAERVGRQAYEFRRDAFGPDHIKTTDALTTLAVTIFRQGRFEEAEAIFWETMHLYQLEFGTNHRTTAESLNSIAAIYLSQARYEEALPLMSQALAINRAVRRENHPGTLGSQNNLAALHYRMGNLEAAKASFLEVLNAREVTLGLSHPDTLTSVNDLALVYIDQGLLEQAEPLLERALTARILKLGNSHPDTAETYWALGKLTYTQGDLNLAIYLHKRAINILQKLRQDLAGSGNKTQAAYAAKWRRAYLDLQRLLVEKGLFSSAELVGRMVKQAEFSGFVRGALPSGDREVLALNGQELDWDAELKAMAERPSRLSELIVGLRTRRASGETLSKLEQQQLSDLEAAYDKSYTNYRTTIDGWLKDVRALEDEQVQEEARALELASSERMQGLLLDIGSDVALLQIVAFENSLHLFLITPSGFKHVAVPVRRTEIFNAIFEARGLIEDGRYAEVVEDPEHLAELKATLGKLHGWLVAPVAQDLADAGTRTLMLNVQGEIRYVPFGALWDGDGWLTERYELAIFTPAAQTQFKVPRTLDRGTAFGLTDLTEGFSPLPAVREELRIVFGDGAHAGVIEGSTTLNAQFTRVALEDALTAPPPVLHIASHFAIRPGNEAASFLVLGDGSHLSVAEISRSARLRFRGVELLTLSACDTAISGEGAGLEIEGLGVLAQNKGATSVIASLWAVADDTTPRFMQVFYESVVSGQQSKAAALREAQLEMIRSGEASHPFYWAPFVLMGNWR